MKLKINKENEVYYFNIAVKELERKGLKHPEKPTSDEEYCKLPSDITKTTENELGKYYTAYTQMLIYAMFYLSVIKMALKKIDSNISDFQVMNIYQDIPKQYKTAKEKTDYTRATNEELNRKYKLKEEFEAKEIVLSAIVSGYDKACNLISREISRRTIISERENRGYNVERWNY